MSLYHYASGLPILYAVKNRDTGKLDVAEIEPPVPLEDIVDRVLDMELAIRKSMPVPCSEDKGSFWFRNCPFRYLHDAEPVVPTDGAADGLDIQGLLREYLAAKHAGEAAESKMDAIKEKLLPVAKAKGNMAVRVDDTLIKIKYQKASEPTSYPKAKLEEIVPAEMLAKCAKKSQRGEYIVISLGERD